jgi:hypothetical protein
VRRWAKANGVTVHQFKKGENKEAYARPLIEAAAKEGGQGRVVLLGIAQEKAFCWRAWRSKTQPHTARPHMEWGRQAAFVNHFYFYLWDPDWGGAFWKTNAYAPYQIWIYLCGHEWAKRQLEKAGGARQRLSRLCKPVALAQICARLGPGPVQSFFWRWFHRLPSPFTDEDLRVGFVYEAVGQFEISDTRVFNHPAAGRAFFEG